jgi:hypothetical protein
MPTGEVVLAKQPANVSINKAVEMYFINIYLGKIKKKPTVLPQRVNLMPN